MTKVTREDSMTKVIQSFQSSDLQPLNARLLRGEVDPWETSSLNNPLLLLGLENSTLPICGFTIVKTLWENTILENLCFPGPVERGIIKG